MRIIHTTTWFLSLVAALGAGCSHPSTGAVQPPATPTAGATGPAAVENAKQKREEMDPAHALFQAARDQQLHPDQTTKVLGLERQLESNERETVPAFQTFHAD